MEIFSSIWIASKKTNSPNQAFDQQTGFQGLTNSYEQRSDFSKSFQSKTDNYLRSIWNLYALRSDPQWNALVSNTNII